MLRERQEKAAGKLETEIEGQIHTIYVNNAMAVSIYCIQRGYFYANRIRRGPSC